VRHQNNCVLPTDTRSTATEACREAMLSSQGPVYPGQVRRRCRRRGVLGAERRGFDGEDIKSTPTGCRDKFAMVKCGAEWDEPNDRLRHIFGPEMWRSELMDLTLKVPNHCVGLSLREQTVQGSNRYQYHHLLFNSVSPCLQYAACAPFACRLGRVLGLCPKTNTARGIAS
jgi:hypothetical protein